jgi:hypothetical protein
VADGNAQYTTVRPPELDDVLKGYLELRDPVGTDLNEESAHGSYFDRVSAFQEGFADGVTACRDDFDTNRVLTQRSFSDEDIAQDRAGDAPLDVLVDLVDTSLPPFWEDVVTSAGGDFEEPTIESMTGGPPGCAEDELDYCEGENIVAIDGAGFGREAYDQIGDFALITAVAIPYALDARDQLGLSTDDEDAIRSAVCATGSYGRAVYNGDLEGVQISPGDLDEGVIFLLTYGNDPQVIPDANLTGFQLVDIFRTGFTRGVDACGLDG